jgi:putative SOS response-associated peptidase YedK
MCGRIRQARDERDYLEIIHWNPRQILPDARQPRYNVPPGTRPLALHRLGDGHEQANHLFWGYKPRWYKRGPASNARLDTVLRGSSLWKPLLGRRIIVPADGWYEWTGDKGDKQPWFISARNGGPVLMAGITAWMPGKEVLAETGFAVITDDAAGGMVDIHDRRPVCLSPDDALAWLDPETATDDALALLSTARPESAFQWWEVTRAMGSSKYQLAGAADMLDGRGH